MDSSAKRASLKTLPLRYRLYQKERHPVWLGIPMAAAISYSGITFSALLAHRAPPNLIIYLIGFVVTFCFHLQRRIADDLRNIRFDRKYQPNRPIPRGLVSANELRFLFVGLMPVQALLSMMVDIRMFGPLLVTTVFIMFLTMGFGPLRWNNFNPIFYLFFHRFAAPFTIFTISALEWLPRHGSPHPAIALLLIVSFLNSFALEIGRNFDLPGEGLPESRSYAKFWGPRKASVIWWMMINLAAIFSSLARVIRGAPVDGMLVLLAGVVITGLFAYRVAATLNPKAAALLNPLSSMWTITMFLTVVLG